MPRIPPDEDKRYFHDAASYAMGWGGNPEIGHREWLRIHYITSGSMRGADPLRATHPEHTLFKIVRHVRGGD